MTQPEKCSVFKDDETALEQVKGILIAFNRQKNFSGFDRLLTEFGIHIQLNKVENTGFK